MSTSSLVSTHRTQIYLPKDLYTEAMDHAKKTARSLAEVIRDALQTHLADARKMQGKDDLITLKGSLAESAPKDLAKNLNKYLNQMYSK